MKLILYPLVFSIGFIAFENRDKIIDQYEVAYPSDPAKQAAIEACISRNRYFNRLDADDRKHCYRQYLAGPSAIPTPVALTPAASPSYPYNPSHLPGNDIRREEANDGYRPSPLISSAQAAQMPQPVATAPSDSPPRQTTHHPAPAHHNPAPTPHRPTDSGTPH